MDEKSAPGSAVASALGHGNNPPHHSDHIHLPSNSWTPIALALSLALTFVGFLIHPVVWLVGLALVIATLIGWASTARSEFLKLP